MAAESCDVIWIYFHWQKHTFYYGLIATISGYWWKFCVGKCKDVSL